MQSLIPVSDTKEQEAFTSSLQDVWKAIVIGFWGSVEAEPLAVVWAEFTESFQQVIPEWAYQRYCNYRDKFNKRRREESFSPTCSSEEDEGDIDSSLGSSSKTSATDNNRTSKRARKVL